MSPGSVECGLALRIARVIWTIPIYYLYRLVRSEAQLLLDASVFCIVLCVGWVFLVGCRAIRTESRTGA